jgi:hypothetical protein
VYLGWCLICFDGPRDYYFLILPLNLQYIFFIYLFIYLFYDACRQKLRYMIFNFLNAVCEMLHLHVIQFSRN